MTSINHHFRPHTARVLLLIGIVLILLVLGTTLLGAQG